MDWEESELKRALVIRHGASGDCIIASACVPYLHNDGFEVHFMTNDRGRPLVEHNPHIAKVVHFTDNVVPIEYLHKYYDNCSQDYDRTVVLTQSVEARFLHAFPDPQYYWTIAKRRKESRGNYYNEAIRVAGYDPIPGKATGELYFGKDDILFAKDFRYKFKGKFLVVWALAGSSTHKSYLHFEPVARELLRRIPECVIVQIGSVTDLEVAFRHERAIPFMLYHPGASMMRSLSLTRIADLVIGPETAALNAAGCFDTPKICLLTHSSRENLTATWKNDYSLQSMTWCSPCHILHKHRHIWQRICPLEKELFHATGVPAPACVGEGFPPQVVLDRIFEVYETHFKKKG